MISNVSSVTIFVQDQARAKAFYTEKLGLRLTADYVVGDSDKRWLTVAAEDQSTEIILSTIDTEWQHYQEIVGKRQAVTFSLTSADEYEALKARGVIFIQAPQEETWGYHALIQDSEGNEILLLALKQ